MTFLGENSETSTRVRFAGPADARAIGRLYVRAYTPNKTGTASDHYPFPQIMEEDRVSDLIMSGTVIWVVAEKQDGTIVGSAAAVRNIGARPDRIAEIFGVVVDQGCRRGGVGSTLLQKLKGDLERSSEFILCEARTAEAGGWKAARNAGFQPVGFEPYAHSMPVGFESMVLTACWNWKETTHPREVGAAGITKASLSLANTLSRGTSANLLPLATSGDELPRRVLRSSEISRFSLNVRRDDRSGCDWFRGSPDAFDRRSALVELHPLQGAEPSFRRFEDMYYVASIGESDVAAARLFYDRIDARARILGLRADTEGVEPWFLKGIAESLSQLAGDGPMVVVACVRSGASAIQIALENLGFVPTAYLPRMIATPGGRTDVIQYTRLFGRSWYESVRSVTALEWPEARVLINKVIDLSGVFPFRTE